MSSKIMNLKHKIVKGGFYLALTNILQQFTAIAVNIVLARLLMPSDFGLIAISTTYIGFISMFTNLGFGSAIIHDQKSSQEQLSSLYWINFVFSLFTFFIVVGTASWAASFYDEPRLTMVVLCLAVNILITPIFSTHAKILERDIEFKILSRISLTATFAGAVTGVVAAFAGIGVYALVLHTLSATVIRMILILLISAWKPSRVFRFSAIKSMVWYSVKFKISSSVLYVDRNIDYLVLGKVFSSVILGYYAFAYNIMYTPVKRISYIFSGVLFPSFSAIRENRIKLINAYFRSMRMIALITFPTMVILSLNAHLIINFVFGHKWNDALPIVQILCFAGAVQSISQVGGVVFASIGKPEVSTYVGLVRTALTVAAILVGAMHGILTVAYLLVVAKVLSFVLVLVVMNRFVRFSFTTLISELSGPLMTAVGLIAVEALVRSIPLHISLFSKLNMMVVLSVLMTWGFHKQLILETFAILRSRK